MGMVFRALVGFAIAFALLYPKSWARRFDTPKLGALRVEIADQHPGPRLRDLLSKPPAALRGDDSAAAE